MFVPGVHGAPSTHALYNRAQGRREIALTSQSFHQRPSSIAYHQGQFNQAALRILPGQQDDEPVLQHHADQLGIQFAQHPPGVCRSPLINVPILLPKLEKPFDLPALS